MISDLDSLESGFPSFFTASLIIGETILISQGDILSFAQKSSKRL